MTPSLNPVKHTFFRFGMILAIEYVKSKGGNRQVYRR